MIIAKHIDTQIVFASKLSRILKNQLSLQDRNSQASDLVMQVEDIILGLQQSFRLTLAGQEVKQKLQGISLLMIGKVCVKRVCFDALNTTMQYISDEESCPLKEAPKSSFYIRGTKSISLGFGLRFPKGKAISITIQRESDRVRAFVEDKCAF